MRKRWLASLLSLAMLLSLTPTAVFAAEPEETEAVTVTEAVDTSDADLPDNDELFAGYVQGLLYPSYGSISLFANWGSSTGVLNDAEQGIYTQLKEQIMYVAANGGSTEFTLDVSSLNITWTGASDGYKEILNTSKIVDCLLVDCPYDLYWFDKTAGASWGVNYSQGSTYKLTSLTATLYVAQSYQDGSNTAVNASQVTAAETAAAKAQTIVNTNASKSDYEKLLAYKNEICNLVDYNYDAAGNANTPYGAPWQLIYVFDENPDTNVVCEGYAKAFQYLCDLSGLTCYTVTGTMRGGTGAGRHMWNIVTLEGNNYLVDVTNSDSGSVGQDGGLFMAGASGSVQGSYTAHNVTYTYDADIINLYGEDILTLSDTSYTPPKQVYTLTVTATCGAASGQEITVAVPTAVERQKTVTLTATAKYDDGSSGTVNATWNLRDAYTGVTLSGNTITILPEAGDYGNNETIIVNVSYGTGWDWVYITLPKKNAQATTIDISGRETLAIPDSDTGVSTDEYTATVYDQYGAEMQSAAVEWSVSGSGSTGVSVDQTGTVTVNSSAAADTVTLTATCGDASKAFEIQLSEKSDAGVTIADAPTEVVMGEGGFELHANATIPIKKNFQWSTNNSQVLKVQNTSGTLSSKSYIAVEGPGTATIKVTYEDDTHYGSDSVTITVLKKPTLADFNVTLPSDAVYDSTAKQATVAVKDGIAGMGAVTIKYNGVTTVPTDAGTYQVTFDVATGTGYASATGLVAGTFTITKAEQAALSITSANTVTYGDTLALTTSGGTGTGAVIYTVTDGTGKATISGSTLTPTQAGTVTVTATKAGGNNYNDVSVQKEITIAKANYTNTNTAAGSARYGTSGTVDLSSLIASGGTATVGTVTDSDGILNGAPTLSGNVLTFALLNDSGKVGATAEIPVNVTNATNYNTYTITVTVTVTDKLTPVLTVSDITVTYTGQPVPASAIQGTATYDGKTVPGTWSWTGGNAYTNAGSYQQSVTFTPSDTDTYTTNTATAKVTINKATPAGTPGYTAISTSGKALADAKLTTGSFTVKGSVAWADDADTQVEVNTSYKWIFTPDDTDNYNTVTGAIELWHRSSSSGGSSSSGNKTETEKNPDGSSTTTVTKPNGTVTETTKNPDGSQEVIETKKDGTVTTTTTDKTGNKTEVVENTDGSSQTTVDNKDGSSSVTKVDEDGKVEAQVTLSTSVVEDADGGAVTLPMPEVRATSDRDEAPTVTVDLPRNTSAKVEIPVRRVTSGTVAVLVKADGTEQVIKTSLTTDNGVTVTLSDGDTVKIVDNSKTFDDVSASYWGSDYIDFVTSREIFSGTGANTFAPDLPMNRAMIVTVLAAYDGADTSSTGGAWYEAGQRWAMLNGISDGTNMEQNLTREQLAVMLWSYAGRPTDGGSLAGYSDMGNVSSWATQAMAWAVKNGLISGMDGTLAPQGTATRAQVATILTRFVEQAV